MKRYSSVVWDSLRSAQKSRKTTNKREIILISVGNDREVTFLFRHELYRSWHCTPQACIKITRIVNFYEAMTQPCSSALSEKLVDRFSHALGTRLFQRRGR